MEIARIVVQGIVGFNSLHMEGERCRRLDALGGRRRLCVGFNSFTKKMTIKRTD